jgi:hypothetical protein
MATAAVVATTTNTRVNSSDVNTNWGNWGSGGGAPASEAQLAYLGTAVNTQVKTTALDGIDYDHSGTASLDMTTSTLTLWIVKVIVGDSFDTNTTLGVNVAIGSALTAMREFNIAGSGANGLTAVYDEYPAQGGYIITAINPDANATYQRVADTGSPAWTAVDWWGVQCAMVVGGAKNENLAMDSIDVGSGLELHAGDGGSADADMDVLVIADQGSPGTPGTRWGYVVEKNGIISCLGIMEVGRSGGSAAITEFTDTDSIVVFPDAYYGPGDCGFLFDLGNASTIMVVGMTIIGRGILSGSDDSRPDHIVTGTSGAYTFTGTLTNHRNVTFTSVCDVAGSVECQLLTQGSANIENATILTSAITNVACLQDPVFAVATDLNNTTFIQGATGVGHAIEIDTAGTHDLEELFFSGYGGTPGTNLVASTGAADAAIYNSSGGAVTINVTGDTPSIRNAAGSSTTVNNTVTILVTALDAATLTAISGARVLVRAATGGDLPFEASVTITTVTTTASVSHTGHGFANGAKVDIKGANEDELNGVKTVANATANAYDYTIVSIASAPGTGTIVATAVIIDGTTNGSGEASASLSYTNPQDVAGRVRKSTASPYFKTSAVVGEITTAGLTATVVMISDE